MAVDQVTKTGGDSAGTSSDSSGDSPLKFSMELKDEGGTLSVSASYENPETGTQGRFRDLDPFSARNRLIEWSELNPELEREILWLEEQLPISGLEPQDTPEVFSTSEPIGDRPFEFSTPRLRSEAPPLHEELPTHSATAAERTAESPSDPPAVPDRIAASARCREAPDYSDLPEQTRQAAAILDAAQPDRAGDRNFLERLDALDRESRREVDKALFRVWWKDFDRTMRERRWRADGSQRNGYEEQRYQARIHFEKQMAVGKEISTSIAGATAVTIAKNYTDDPEKLQAVGAQANAIFDAATGRTGHQPARIARSPRIRRPNQPRNRTRPSTRKRSQPYRRRAGAKKSVPFRPISEQAKTDCGLNREEAQIIERVAERFRDNLKRALEEYDGDSIIAVVEAHRLTQRQIRQDFPKVSIVIEPRTGVTHSGKGEKLGDLRICDKQANAFIELKSTAWVRQPGTTSGKAGELVTKGADRDVPRQTVQTESHENVARGEGIPVLTINGDGRIMGFRESLNQWQYLN